MDPVTHTLVGVGMANAFFRKRVGKGAVPVLALASNLPDVDALVHLTGDPAAILMRRTFGHSLLLLPLWSLGLSAVLKRFFPSQKFLTLWGLTLLGGATHLFFDLVNSFGVVPLWPLSDWRPELATVFIIDLYLTGLLALPLVLSRIPKLTPRFEWLSRMAIIGAAVYVLFCGINRLQAERLLAADLKKYGLHPDFTYVFPEPLGPHRWRGVVRTENVYLVYLIRSLSGEIKLKGTIRSDRGDPSVEKARETALAQKIEWFFKAPVWTAETPPLTDGSGQDSVEATVYDLRFRPIVIDRGTPFIFRFHVQSDGLVQY